MSQKLLHHFRTIVLNCEEQELRHHQSMLWGQLASFLLSSGATQTEAETSQTDSDAAAALVHGLSDLLDEPALLEALGKKEILLKRTWLLHWALFLIFVRQEQGSPSQTKLLEWFLDEKNLSVMSISCPHLYRYVGACLILNSKRLKHLLNSSGSPVWVLKHEKHSYSDPITDFLLALYCDVDFDEAQRQLLRCRVVCKGDFFLSRWWDDHFEENARLLIFETYCRIHQCINLEMIASKLNMDPQAAELWIVKLIQNAKLDARIDSAKKRVVMSKAPPNVYQQVIEKTKNLAFRSTMLLSNLEKKERHQPRDHR
jgi:translation initiation factor 3 subunit E